MKRQNLEYNDKYDEKKKYDFNNFADRLKIFYRYENSNVDWWEDEIKNNVKFKKWLQQKNIKESGKTFDQ